MKISLQSLSPICVIADGHNARDQAVLKAFAGGLHAIGAPATITLTDEGFQFTLSSELNLSSAIQCLEKIQEVITWINNILNAAATSLI